MSESDLNAAQRLEQYGDWAGASLLDKDRNVVKVGANVSVEYQVSDLLQHVRQTLEAYPNVRVHIGHVDKEVLAKLRERLTDEELERVDFSGPS